MAAANSILVLLLAGTASAQWNPSPSPSPNNNIYYNAGNVGIGTSSPGQKLEVAGGLRIGGAATLAAAMGAGTFSYDHPVLREFVGDGTGYSRVFSRRVSSTTTDLVAILDTGSVGIGTTSPTRQLTISGANQADLALVSVDQGALVTDGFNLQQSGVNTNLINREAGTMAFWTNATQQMTILSGGNVGIGTTGPGQKLEVSGNVTLGGAGTGNFFYPYYNSSTNYAGMTATSGGNLQFFTGLSAPAARLVIDTTGNVGIGTPSPGSYKLNVYGDTNVTGDLNVTGNIKAKFQDMAEWVPTSEQLLAGTVVVLDTTRSNQVISSAQAYDTRVAGVVSEKPGITLGEGGVGRVLVATTGRVLVKVDATKGPIHIGDLLVTSDIPGMAMKSEPVNLGGVQLHRPGTLIGKALEPLEKGSGKILVLLSLQ